MVGIGIFCGNRNERSVPGNERPTNILETHPNNVSAREHFFVPCGDKTFRAVTILMCKIHDLSTKYAR